MTKTPTTARERGQKIETPDYSDESIRQLVRRVEELEVQNVRLERSRRAFLNVVEDLKEAEARVTQLNQELERLVAERTARLQSMTLAPSMLEETERERLAAELHDGVLQFLAAAAIRAWAGCGVRRHRARSAPRWMRPAPSSTRAFRIRDRCSPN